MKCPKCGFDNPAGMKFCGHCGEPMAIQPISEEKRLVTVLFADLSGFTALSHKLDPDDVSELVNICFERLNPVVVKHKGIIHKYEGDLVIALFGVPEAREDDAERAVKASFEMMAVLPEINKVLSERLKMKTDLGLHIGISSGTVALSEIGSPEKKEYTVMGDIVNLASRLKDAAKRGEIFVSEPVFRQTRYLFEYEVLPPISVKGIEIPVRIFKPVKIRDKPEPRRGIQGLSSPLIGRDKEFGTLRDAVDKIIGLSKGEVSAEAIRKLVVILGDAGVGKSRLFEEIKKYISDNKLPVTVLVGGCLPHGDCPPNWPFLKILETIFGIADMDGPELIQDKLIKGTKEIFPDNWQEVVPYLAYLFSVRFTDKLDEKIRHLDHSEPVPILFVLISRIEKETEPWEIKERLRQKLGARYLEITLAPLDYDASLRLAENLLRISMIPERLRDRILTRAEGNPLFLEEMLRSLIDSGVLVYESGAWHSTSTISDIEIPDTVQAIILARFDRLRPELKALLQSAAVIGRNFYETILACIAGLDTLMLSLNLATLEEYEYIRRVSSPGDADFDPRKGIAYEFRHPLIPEVIYHTIFKKRRRELHHKVGRCIEEHFSERIMDFCDLLARQYYSAGDYKKAFEYSIKSARKAKEFYQNRTAIGFYDMAIECAVLLEDTRTMVECMKEKAGVLRLVGESEKALKDVDGAIRLSKELKDKKLIADCILQKGRIYSSLSRYEEALKAVAEALKLYEELNDRKGMADCILNIGTTEGRLGNYSRALQCFNRSMKISKEIGDRRGVVRCLHNIGIVQNRLGNYIEALKYYDYSLKIFEEIGDREGEAINLSNIGVLEFQLGNYTSALDYLNRSLRIRREIGNRYGEAISLQNIGAVQGKIGNYASALDYLQRSLRIRREIGDRYGEAYNLQIIGEVQAGMGELDRSRETLHRALKCSEEVGNKEVLRRSHIALARLYLQTDQYNKVEQHLKAAFALAEELGSKQGWAEALLIQARWEGAKGKIDDHAFEESINIFKQLNIPFALASAYYHYAEAMIRNGEKDRDKVARCLESAEEIFRKMGAERWLKQIEQLKG